MGDVVKAIFGTSKPEPKPQGPSAAELASQKKQQDLAEAKNRRESSERNTRTKIISARAAGPQTLFTRPGQIPRPVRLGGGRS